MNEAQFRNRMNKVAEMNDDRFKTTITVEDETVSVTVIETADNHTFLSGSGDDVESAIDDAMKDLTNALDNWGYEDAT